MENQPVNSRNSDLNTLRMGGVLLLAASVLQFLLVVVMYQLTASDNSGFQFPQSTLRPKAMFVAFAGFVLLLLLTVFGLRWFRAVSHREKRVAELEVANIDLQRQERRARILGGVASAANGSADVNKAFSKVLELICAEFRWQIGHVDLRTGYPPELRSSRVWFADPAVDASEFRRLSFETLLSSGEGLPGRVLRDGRAEWISNVAAAVASPRINNLSESRIRSAFAFPVPVAGTVEAVLEFFSYESREPDSELMDLAVEIGAELGCVLLRKKIEADLIASEQILHETQEIAGVGTWEFDPITTKIQWSPQTFRLLGFETGSVVPEFEEHIQTVHPDDRPILVSHLDDLAKYGTEYKLIIRYCTVAGRQIWASVHGRAVYAHSQIVKLRGTIQDITPLKSVEEELREAKMVAEDASRAKGNFLANISHEIRTPLNAILGMAYLALKTDLSARQRDYIEKIHISGTALLGIINNVLDFSKIESGKMKLDSVEFKLSEVLKSISSILLNQAEEKGIELSLSADAEVPDRLVGDPLRFGQVLINLVGNALKFTERGSVVVSVTAMELHSDQVVLEVFVKDTGIGLEEKEITGLFQPFSQADASTTRRFGGTGLGLAISNQIVGLMNGSMQVHSIPGAGSTFSFTSMFGIPRRTRSQLRAGSLAGLRVLIVDDDPTAREQLLNIITSFSFAATVAVNGETALAAVLGDQAEEYDLILMDWKMPDLDGITVAKKIKLALEEAAPVIIVVSAYSAEQMSYQAYADQSCIDGYLLKPVMQSVLFETVLQIFENETESGTVIEQQPAPTSAVNLRGARVLLVEDNELNLQVASEILAAEGVELTLARDGQQALDLIARSPRFDAVLMDVQMPVLDGYAATRQLRQTVGGADVPVIAMTATAMNDDIRQAFSAGMDAHIAKPINPNQLSKLLYTFVTHGRAAAQEHQGVPGRPQKQAPEMELPGIRVSELIHRLRGNQTKAHAFLRQFALEYDRFDQKIAEAITGGDRATAGRLAHTLRGVSANLGMAAVTSLCGELEEALASGGERHDPAALAGLLKNLRSELAGVLHSIQALPAAEPHEQFEQAEPGGGPEFADLARLLRLLEESDTEGVTELERMRSDFLRAGLEAEYTECRASLSRYDFESAVRLLTRLREEGFF